VSQRKALIVPGSWLDLLKRKRTIKGVDRFRKSPNIIEAEGKVEPGCARARVKLRRAFEKWGCLHILALELTSLTANEQIFAAFQGLWSNRNWCLSGRSEGQSACKASRSFLHRRRTVTGCLDTLEIVQEEPTRLGVKSRWVQSSLP
jgi:hypothetical protein